MTRMSKENRWVRSGLVMLGVVALAGSLAGCGGSGPPPPCDPAQIQTTWIVTQNGQSVGCAPGDEVDIIVDAMERPFNCSAFFGITPPFDAGTHTITLELRDVNQTVLSRLGPMTKTFACGELDDLHGVEFSLTP